MQVLRELWQNLLATLHTFSFVDVIDILIVSYLVYKTIKLVKESRAQQLVKGILILSIGYAISHQLGLRTMSFILVNIFQIGIVAIVVVFQPELRRALEQVGRSKLSGLNVLASVGVLDESKEAQQWETAIAEICDAAVSLSLTKTGALIVFERQTKLGDIIKTGTIIDSQPSRELIGNIFYPNTPLHDGAMIVRQGKLYAAGCFLPLSDNNTISRELGTRHRAALGMSENSDAVVLTVSEETGKISIAIAGQIQRNFNYDTLKAKLTKELLPDKNAEGSEKKAGFWKVKSK